MLTTITRIMTTSRFCAEWKANELLLKQSVFLRGIQYLIRNAYIVVYLICVCVFYETVLEKLCTPVYQIFCIFFCSVACILKSARSDSSVPATDTDRILATTPIYHSRTCLLSTFRMPSYYWFPEEDVISHPEHDRYPPSTYNSL